MPDDPIRRPQVGDRVQLRDPDDEGAIVLGTVRSASKAGYVQVDWDHEIAPDWFSPRSADARLVLVTGDASRRRHQWGMFRNDWKDATCMRCHVDQTDMNYWEACDVG